MWVGKAAIQQLFVNTQSCKCYYCMLLMILCIRLHTVRNFLLQTTHVDVHRQPYWLKITAFCNTVPSSLGVDRYFRGVYRLQHQGDYRGSMHLWNVSLLSNYTLLYHRTQSSSYSQLWEPENSHSLIGWPITTYNTTQHDNPEENNSQVRVTLEGKNQGTE
jgi:hypothetical protein